jgi:acetyl-CoA carboxylase carboxyl transferase subunit alpha
VVDEVLPEPLGAAHRNPAAAADVIRNALLKHLQELDRFDIDQLLETRQRRIAGFGQFKE